MKILAQEHDRRKFQLLVNLAASAKEAQMVFHKLNRVTQQFLDFSIDLLGWIPYDTRVQKAVRQQKTVVESYSKAQAGRAFLRLAMAICALPTTILPSGQIQFFWQRLFR
jgi:flagellar biosynthesis protein FlhG